MNVVKLQCVCMYSTYWCQVNIHIHIYVRGLELYCRQLFCGTLANKTALQLKVVNDENVMDKCHDYICTLFSIWRGMLGALLCSMSCQLIYRAFQRKVKVAQWV